MAANNEDIRCVMIHGGVLLKIGSVGLTVVLE